MMATPTALVCGSSVQNICSSLSSTRSAPTAGRTRLALSISRPPVTLPRAARWLGGSHGDGGDVGSGVCLVEIGSIAVAGVSAFYFTRSTRISVGSASNLTVPTPQIRVGSVTAGERSQVAVDRNTLTCGDGGPNALPCTSGSPFLWFTSLIALSGSVAFSVSNNTCGEGNASLSRPSAVDLSKALLILISERVAPCVLCNVYLCNNALFGEHPDGSVGCDGATEIRSKKEAIFVFNKSGGKNCHFFPCFLFVPLLIHPFFSHEALGVQTFLFLSRVCMTKRHFLFGTTELFLERFSNRD